MEFSEKFIDKNIAELAEYYDKVFAANVNIARIASDLVDGLKVVQRRILYDMFTTDADKKFKKVASISGDVIGHFHPHAQTAVSDSTVGMAQSWRNILPLIEPYGNFGDISGSPAGADRYIQAKLSDYTIACFFEDWKDSVVDMELAFDEETMAPLYLPAKYPNALLNGCKGIGHMGVSCNIPAFNFREVAEATIKLILNPKADIVLIPDSPTGADIIQTDFHAMCNSGRGSYMQRCTYEIDDAENTIRITSLPDTITSNTIRERIADIKEKGGLAELIGMDDMSGKQVDIRLIIRSDVNPYKFMKKLIGVVGGLQHTFPVVITVTYNYKSYDWSIKQLLLEWIKWRREQKHVVVSNKRAVLTAEQRINDIKLFIMNDKNLEETIKIFRTSHNRAEIEERLIKRYHNTEIRLDSLQARALSNMRMVELTIDAYTEYKEKAEELKKKLAEVEDILKTDNGIDKLIIAELRDGVKRFGAPRRSNVVPYQISTANEVEGFCIIQLSSDGTVIRRAATNAEEEPIPTDNNGFACIVDNDSSFILIAEDGMHTYVKVKDIPLDTEFPVYRFANKVLTSKIIAMVPVDIDANLCCTLVSKRGICKRFRVADLTPRSRAVVSLEEGDALVRGITLPEKSQRELLIFTKNGLGQRLENSSVKITAPTSKGMMGFNVKKDDEIIGLYSINPDQNQYILYVTTKGKTRLNLLEYLPTRNSKRDSMVQLINISDRDKLMAVVGCNKLDKIQVFYDDGTNEVLEIETMPEETMGAEPKKLVKKNMVSAKITKTKLL